jgi:glucose-1-phosphate cytidylyltransferase
MKVIILAGGFGTRMAEYTESIPKPMVTVGDKPIIWHIMNTYAKYNHFDFYLALGYKAEYINEYFSKLLSNVHDKKNDFNSKGSVTYQKNDDDIRVTLVDTGLKSMTGGRVKRMKKFIKNETFLLTYGDGVSNIDLDKLLDFHRSHGKMVTVSAVHPVARFGELEINGYQQVKSFKEKPQTANDWINGGYFVIEPDFFDLILDDSTILEKKPLERVAEMGELMAYKHEGYWHCMDTKRDRELLEELWKSGEAPWK